MIYFWDKQIRPNEVQHTGSQWEPAGSKFCGDDPNVLPLELACFYNKTNTNVLGSLSCALFVCTPTLLNSDCCNDNSDFLYWTGITNEIIG